MRGGVSAWRRNCSPKEELTCRSERGKGQKEGGARRGRGQGQEGGARGGRGQGQEGGARGGRGQGQEGNQVIVVLVLKQVTQKAMTCKF